jgi:hypothetical protein
VDFRFCQYFGDQLEIEHDHTLFGLPGAVRLLGYRNRVHSGSFDDAIATFQADPTRNAAPVWTSTTARRTPARPTCAGCARTTSRSASAWTSSSSWRRDIGVFLRAMWSDGQSEVVAFNAADRSLSFGRRARGSLWNRPFDVTGIGLGLSWISQSHARYLALGGIDGFIGDGALRQATEGVFELFYSLNLFQAIWLSGDFQLLWNPAYNADRGGPVRSSERGSMRSSRTSLPWAPRALLCALARRRRRRWRASTPSGFAPSAPVPAGS